MMLPNAYDKTIRHLSVAYNLPLSFYGKLYSGQEFPWIKLSIELN